MERKMDIESIMTFLYTVVIIISFIFLFNVISNVNNKNTQDEIYQELGRVNTYINTILQKNDTKDNIKVITNPFDVNRYAIELSNGSKKILIFSKDNNLYELRYGFYDKKDINNANIVSKDVIFNANLNNRNLITYYLKNTTLDKEVVKTYKYFIKTN